MVRAWESSSATSRSATATPSSRRLPNSEGRIVDFSTAVAVFFQRETLFRRGSQVGKAEVCKTFMHRFDSGPRLQNLFPNPPIKAVVGLKINEMRSTTVIAAFPVLSRPVRGIPGRRGPGVGLRLLRLSIQSLALLPD